MNLKCVFLAGATTMSLSCYTYRPATLESVPVGSEVRALVSTEGPVRLLYDAGIDAREIYGRLAMRDGDTVRFDIRPPVAASELGSAELYQRVSLPRREVLWLHLRQFDGLKTGGLIAAIGGAVAGAVILGSAVIDPGGPPAGPTGPGPGR